MKLQVHGLVLIVKFHIVVNADLHLIAVNALVANQVQFI
jgi:hypothetical protein